MKEEKKKAKRMKRNPQSVGEDEKTPFKNIEVECTTFPIVIKLALEFKTEKKTKNFWNGIESTSKSFIKVLSHFDMNKD